MIVRKNIGFRAWFYFRQGWSTYFAFLLAAVNTMVVTYYLAIEKAPFLKSIFPTFINYIIMMVGIGIPILVFVGYLHYKKTAAFSSEVDINVESNPYLFKLYPGYTTEVLFPLYLTMSNVLVKLSKNEKLTDEELKEIRVLQEKIKILIKGGYIGKFKRKMFADDLDKRDQIENT